MERSQEMIIAILAVMKCGGAYVPIDPDYPKKRLKFIIEDTQLSILLTQYSLQNTLSEYSEKNIYVDEIWQQIATQSDENLVISFTTNSLAYTIYTSGSTGIPKGVCCYHHSVVNLLTDFQQRSSIGTGDQSSFWTSFSFDVSVYEIFSPLISGATLHIVPEMVRISGILFSQWLFDNNINSTYIPPFMLHNFSDWLNENSSQSQLKRLLVGVEPIAESLLISFQDEIPELIVINGYGPTEATICSTLYSNIENAGNSITPIGRPVNNTTIYILDDNMQPVPIGISGELYIGGKGLAKHYWNRPELSNERFVTSPFDVNTEDRLYKTGDIAKYKPDGNIIYIGRIDTQVKLRGFRIELGEIEVKLEQHKTISKAIAHVNKDNINNPFLVAYLVLNNSKEKFHHKHLSELEQLLKQYLREHLPQHMIPSFFVPINKIPFTPNGKIDYKNLPYPRISQDKPIKSQQPVTKIEKIIETVIKKELNVNQIGLNSHFFDDIGGNSLNIANIHHLLEKQLPYKLSIIDLFEYPTIKSLTQFLMKNSDDITLQSSTSKTNIDKQHKQVIAIIGMSGRFPGAKNVPEFWDKIKQGVELITQFTDKELLASGISKSLLKNEKYVKAKGYLPNIDQFDTNFFNFNPNEARITDPQQRLFLECAWEAFEDAGYNPKTYSGSVGVFSGCSSVAPYLLKNLFANTEIQEIFSEYQLGLSNATDFLSSRTAYKLNLKGPVATVQSACSTSLVATVMGYQALINNQADLILAGGSTVAMPNKNGYLYQEGMIFSPDGHCRTFDAKAKGTLLGNAVGTVLLKRLDDAIRDHDHIYAVIKGAAYDNDGNMKVGFTASGLDGQKRVVKEALEVANISPDTIGYVEAHGTGTPLGDPIEIKALTKAWHETSNNRKNNYCAIGSVKTNVGHCDAAAGVVGLIKTASMLKNKQIPASLHFERPNPNIDFANSPFYVSNTLKEWQISDSPRRAGVSSFGMGGTNAHLILEEAPEREKSSSSRDWQLITLSAKTDTALEKAQQNLSDYLQKNSNQSFADIAYTSHIGRQHFVHRKTIICRDGLQAMDVISSNNSDLQATGKVLTDDPHIVFMFLGQGSQYINMAQELYQTEEEFKQIINNCTSLLKPHLSMDIRSILFNNNDSAKTSEKLNQTALAQPALFVIEYALAKLLMGWGIQPDSLVGHSLGEYTAACLANIMSLEDALHLVSVRGKLMQSMPEGKMLAVPLSEEAIHPWCQDVEIAAVNTPNRCVLSGTTTAIEKIQDKLQQQGIESRLLHTSHAYHSSMMEPAMTEFMDIVKTIHLDIPSIDIISTISGDTAMTCEITEPCYWSSQIRMTVRFADAIQTLLKKPNTIFIEIGPGNTLSSFVKPQIIRRPEFKVVQTLPHPKKNHSSLQSVITALGQLWITGIEIDWDIFYQNECRYRVSLPTYPFERERFWVNPDITKDTCDNLTSNMDNWIYTPYWEKITTLDNNHVAIDTLDYWMVLLDKEDTGQVFVKKLKQFGCHVLTISIGETFVQEKNHFILNPNSVSDFTLLIEFLSLNKFPNHIVNFIGVTSNTKSILEQEKINPDIFSVFYSLIFLAQAIANAGIMKQIQLTMITNHQHSINNKEALQPEKSIIAGTCKVISQEIQNIQCKNIDICLPVNSDLILKNILNKEHNMIAVRKNQCWSKGYRPALLNSQKSPLKQQGVYLITGGLSGIGLELALSLATKQQAKLILVARSEFPKPSLWQRWLEQHDEHHSISVKIRKLLKANASANNYLICKADVTNINDMKNVIRKAESCFSQINGVIHSAGISTGVFVQKQTNANITKTFAPKIQGTWVLHQLFKNKNLDLMVLFSSISTILGGLGFSDYCAANNFLDTYASYGMNNQKTKILTIGWDGWDEVGMGVESAKKQNQLNNTGLSTVDGINTFYRILQSEHHHLLVSTKNLSERMAKGIFIDENKNTENKLTTKIPIQSIDKIKLQLTDIWKFYLGIDHIEQNDDFFEIGGDSLLAVQLLTKINHELSLTLSPHILIGSPTINKLADFIKQTQSTSKTNITNSTSPLLVELQAGNANRQPIYLIHPVGGSVYLYHDLAKKLNKNQPVYGIQAQGWDAKLEPLTSIVDMAKSYVKIIHQHQPTGPYCIGGSSLGGIVAFEMAQQLTSQNIKINLLFMIDTPGIGYMPKNIPESDLDILKYMLNLGIEADISSEKIKQLKQDEQLQYFLDKQQKSGKKLFPDILTLKTFLNLFRINAKAMWEYQADMYSADILFFLAKEKDNINATTPHLAWKKLTKGKVNVIDIPGNHITMNFSPNINLIAEQIDHHLIK